MVWKMITTRCESRKVKEKMLSFVLPVGEYKKSHPAGTPETNPNFWPHEIFVEMIDITLRVRVFVCACVRVCVCVGV